MTINEILELGKMGYTKDDIEKMSEEPKPEQKPEEKKPEQKPEEKPEEKKPEQKPQDPGYNSLAQSIEALIKTIQASNITNSNNKNSGPEETAEEILGNIIMPPLKKGDKTK